MRWGDEMNREERRRQMQALKAYARERDRVFTDFVRSGDIEPVRAFCTMHRMPFPDDDRAFRCAIFKAVQYCTDIPAAVKQLAAEKCRELGMDPHPFG